MDDVLLFILEHKALSTKVRIPILVGAPIKRKLTSLLGYENADCCRMSVKMAVVRGDVPLDTDGGFWICALMARVCWLLLCGRSVASAPLLLYATFTSPT